MLQTWKIILWLLQGASGGVAGYITNKYAVNMLFKEYTPFKIRKRNILPYKFGGVIKNRKEQFVNEISELIERDIINSTTIKEKLSEEAFQDELNNLVDYFLKNFVSKSFNDVKISDIPGSDKSLENLYNCIKPKLGEIIENFILNSKNKVDIKEVISNQQIHSIIDKVYIEVVTILKNNNALEKMLSSLSKKTYDIRLKDFLTKDTADIIHKNLNKTVKKAILELFNDDKKIHDLLENSYEILKLEDAINEFWMDFKETTLDKYITEEMVVKISNKITENLISFLDDDKSKKSIGNLIKKLIGILKENELSIIQILPDKFQVDLTKFILEKLPQILPYVCQWIVINKDEFNKLVEDSIDEAIQGMDGNIKKLIISKFRTVFLNDISEKNNIINKIIDFIENYSLDENTIENLPKDIIKYLNDTKIKDIIGILDHFGITNDELAAILNNIAINIVSKYGFKFIKQILNVQLSKKVSYFFKGNNYSNLLNQYIKKTIFEIAINKKINIAQFLCDSTRKCIDKVWKAIGDKCIGEATKNLNDPLFNILENNSHRIKEHLENKLMLLINNVDLNEKLEENKDLISNFIFDFIKEQYDIKAKEIKNKNINHFIPQINDGCIYEMLTNKIKNQIVNSSDILLKGNVKKICYEYLIKFDENQICDLAQKIMGNELKPLSVFGGILGLATGLIFGLFSPNVNQFGFYNNYVQMILSVVLMGGIGVFTNIIAINMLFRPFTKNKILSRIPLLRKFALGYIPSNKEKFAESIGRTIDEEILNSSSIKNILSVNKEKINHSLYSYIRKNGFAFLSNFFNNNRTDIEDFLNKKIAHYLENTREKNCEIISNSIINMKCGSVFKEDLYNHLINKLLYKKDDICENLIQYLNEEIKKENLHDDNATYNIELDQYKERIYDILNKYINSFLNEEFVKDIVIKEILNEKLLKKRIEEIIPQSIIDGFYKYMKLNIETFIENKLGSLASDKIQICMESEIKEKNTVGSIFDGSIKNIIDSNLEKGVLWLIDFSHNFLRKRKEAISENVKLEIDRNLNFFEKMGYAMANGDEIVDKCVEIAIDKKMRTFMEFKANEIKVIMNNGLNNIIYPAPIHDIIKAEKINISIILKDIFENKTIKDFLSDFAIKANMYILNKFIKCSTGEILDMITLDTQEEIYKIISKPTYMFIKSTGAIITKNKNEYFDYLILFLQKYIINKFNKQNIFSLLEGLNTNELRNNLDLIIKLFQGCDDFKKNIQIEMCRVYKIILDKDIEEFIDENLLYEQLGCLYDKIIEDIESYIPENFAMGLIKGENSAKLDLLDVELKEYLFLNLVNSLIISIENNMENIIRSLSLKEISYEQINTMDSREIYNLFHSFAGTFFKKLYIYGALGSIFGINLYLPILGFILESFNEE